MGGQPWSIGGSSSHENQGSFWRRLTPRLGQGSRIRSGIGSQTDVDPGNQSRMPEPSNHLRMNGSA
jgi:hypothetical protein